MSSDRSADPQLYQTSKLRIVEARDGEDVPRLVRPGWPECGPTHFKLQQWWIDPKDPYGPAGEWRDIEVSDE